MESVAPIVIDEEFRKLIPPLTEEERQQLERNLVADGCRDALVVWKEHGILLDGHNRYEICTRLEIGYRVTELGFESRDEAEDWIDANQLGRRNLKPDQFTLLLGRRYNRAKKSHGGDRKSMGQNDLLISTAKRLGDEHGVSEKTVKRAGQLADAVETLKSTVPDIETRVASGTGPAKRDVIKAAELLESHPEKSQQILSGAAKTADVVRELKREAIKTELEDIATKEVKAASGVYDVIVLDPPWPMEKIERDCRPNQSEFDYPTMTEEELSSLSVPCAGDAHVWVWTTHKFLPMALRLLDSWKLKYVCTFVWHKPGGFQPIGLPQYNCEFAIYARKGSPKFIDTKAFNTCFDAPRGKHSEKPEEFYEVLRRVTAGRRLDMFNRREIEGFDRWGNQA